MRIALLLAVSLSLLTAGCESMSGGKTSLRDRITARDPGQTKTFAADQRAAYDAVRTAATQMGYRFVRGGPSQGEFEAISGVGSGERTGTARQLSMKVRLERALDGGTNVTARITEIIESDSSNRAGLATETPLRDTPQYDVFFRRVGEALGSK